MKTNQKAILVLIFACFGPRLVSEASFMPLANPYLKVVKRNVFGLRAPVLVVTKPEPKQLPEIVLQGIIANVMPKSAIVKIKQPARPGAQASEESFVLRVGQRAGDLQVLDIKEGQRLVTVAYAETVLELTFKQNGVEKPGSLPSQGTPTVAPSLPKPPLAAPETQLTPEQQVILIELEREKNRGNPDYAPLPPTPLTTPEDLKRLMAPPGERR